MSLVSMFVFPAPQPSYTMHSFPNELLWIPMTPADGSPSDGLSDYASCRAGDCVPAVILRSQAARYLIIYLHSNGEDIGLAYPFGCGLRMVLEVHVMLVEYPGYGICPGQCSEESLWRAAQAALRFATETLKWPLDDVIIMGRSLGAAVAMRLAAAHACHGLILVAPFLSLVDAVSQYIGSLAPMLIGNSFCNKDVMRKVKVPTLIIHGLGDRLVSCAQGQQLWDICPHKKKLFVSPEQMSHNSDLLSNADFLIRPMLRFFALPDYSFVDMAIPPEAFDKRHCPQYHTLVETVKGDKPLPRPQGDEEPTPCYATISGPQSEKCPMLSNHGDIDDLHGDGEVNVTSPRQTARSLMPSPARSKQEIDRLNELAREMGLRLVTGPAEPAEPTIPEPEPELTGEMMTEFDTPVKATPSGSAECMPSESPDPLPRSARPPGLFIGSPSALRPPSHSRTSGPATERALPPDWGMDLGAPMPIAKPLQDVDDPEPLCFDEVIWNSAEEVGVLEGQEADWLGHPATTPAIQKDCARVDAKPVAVATAEADMASFELATIAKAESAKLWEEGSSAVPSTEEANESRWSEPVSDVDCKGPTVPGLCILNLENGISRYLHEDDDTA